MDSEKKRKGWSGKLKDTLLCRQEVRKKLWGIRIPSKVFPGGDEPSPRPPPQMPHGRVESGRTESSSGSDSGKSPVTVGSGSTGSSERLDSGKRGCCGKLKDIILCRQQLRKNVEREYQEEQRPEEEEQKLSPLRMLRKKLWGMRMPPKVSPGGDEPSPGPPPQMPHGRVESGRTESSSGSDSGKSPVTVESGSIGTSVKSDSEKRGCCGRLKDIILCRQQLRKDGERENQEEQRPEEEEQKLSTLRMLQKKLWGMRMPSKVSPGGDESSPSSPPQMPHGRVESGRTESSSGSYPTWDSEMSPAPIGSTGSSEKSFPRSLDRKSMATPSPTILEKDSEDVQDDFCAVVPDSKPPERADRERTESCGSIESTEKLATSDRISTATPSPTIPKKKSEAFWVDFCTDVPNPEAPERADDERTESCGSHPECDIAKSPASCGSIDSTVKSVTSDRISTAAPSPQIPKKTSEDFWDDFCAECQTVHAVPSEDTWGLSPLVDPVVATHAWVKHHFGCVDGEEIPFPGPKPEGDPSSIYPSSTSTTTTSASSVA